MILVHCHPPILKALKEAADFSTSFWDPTELETTIAKLICDIVPDFIFHIIISDIEHWYLSRINNLN